MDYFFWFDTINLGMVHCIYRGTTDYNFQIELYFSEDHFDLANSVGPDEIPHHAAFHLGHCSFQKYLVYVNVNALSINALIL